MKPKFKQILEKAGYIFTHYSFILLVAFLAAVSFSILIDNSSLKETSINFYTRFGIVSALGISFLFALNMLSERMGHKILLNLLGITFLMGYFEFILPHNNNDFGTVHAILLAVSFLLSHLLVSFIAFSGKNQEHSFWQFNKNLFINVVLTGIFTVVLVGGIMLALTAVDHLFDLELNNKVYPKTFTFLTIFGSCFIFLLFIEDGLSFLEQEGNYPEILKFFVQFVLIPLLIIYAVILYFYGGKILVKWDLPRGWVSYLILAYSLVGIFALLLVFPLKEMSAKSWVKGFAKIFYYTLFPLLVLLFVAIFTRILEYGFTENRYYVLLMAIWLTVIVLYFSFWKKPNIKFIPISLFAFGLFSLIFPYFNTFSVSKNSQKKQLQEILVKNNLLEKGVINFDKKVQDSTASEIANKFNFLSERKENKFLLKFISTKKQKTFDTLLKKEKYSVYSDIKSQFKNIEYNNAAKKGDKYRRISIYTDGFDYDVEDYEKILKVYNYHNKNFEYDGNTLSLNGFNGALTLNFNNKSIDLSPEVQSILNQYKNKDGDVNVSQLYFTKEVENYELKFILDRLDYNQYSEKKEKYFISNDIIILIKKKAPSKK